MSKRKGKRKNGRKKRVPARKRTIPQSPIPWKTAGGLTALVASVAIGYYVSQEPESIPVNIIEKKVALYSPTNPDRITFEEAKHHIHLQERFLNQLYGRRIEISPPWKQIGGLVYGLVEDDSVPYGISPEEQKFIEPFMATKVEKKGVRPLVYVSPNAFRHCASSDEFYSLLDNEALTCFTNMGKMRLSTDGNVHLTYEGLEKSTLIIVHEMISSQYQTQLIRNGHRKVRSSFQDKMEYTYTYLCYRLKQISDQDLQQRPIIKQWLKIQSPRPNKQIAKELGITVEHRP